MDVKAAVFFLKFNCSVLFRRQKVSVRGIVCRTNKTFYLTKEEEDYLAMQHHAAPCGRFLRSSEKMRTAYFLNGPRKVKDDTDIVERFSQQRKITGMKRDC